MNKQEFYGLLKQKMPTNEEEYNKQYAEFEAEMKERGIEESKLEYYTVGRLQAYYKKLLRSNAVMWEGIIIGITGTNDFGAQKNYDLIKRQYAEADPELKQTMIETLQVRIENDVVIPLFGQDTPSFKRGKDIVPKEERVRKAIVIAKEANSEGEPIAGFLHLKGDKADLKPVLNTPVNFSALKNTNKSTETFLQLSAGAATEFSPLTTEQLDFEKMKGMFKTFFADSCTELGVLEEWHGMHADDYDRIAIVKGNVSRLTMTDQGKNNVVELDDQSLGWDQDPITCWIDESIDIDFGEGAMDVFVIGSTGQNQETQKMSMSAYGFLVMPNEKIGEVPKPVEVDSVKSETVVAEPKAKIAVPELKEPELAPTPAKTSTGGSW